MVGVIDVVDGLKKRGRYSRASGALSDLHNNILSTEIYIHIIYALPCPTIFPSSIPHLLVGVDVRVQH